MLPTDPADPAARALKAAPERWRPTALEVARRAGLRPDRFEPYTDGSALVARVAEEAVVKLIPAAYADEAAAERWALGWLDGRALPVAVPALLGAVEEEGWTALLLGHVPGHTLSSTWDHLDEAARVDLMEQVGELIAAVRALGDPGRAAHAQPWPAFLAARRAGLAAHQADRGLPPHLLAPVEGWVDAAWPARPAAAADALLTGEYTPFNLHVDEVDGRWRLVGMLDLGDAFAGDPRYDLVGPGVFMGAGRPARVAALLRAAGLGEARDLRRPLLALHLLHRFSDLPRQVALPNWREAPDLDTLARWLWPDPA